MSETFEVAAGCGLTTSPRPIWKDEAIALLPEEKRQERARLTRVNLILDGGRDDRPSFR